MDSEEEYSDYCGCDGEEGEGGREDGESSPEEELDVDDDEEGDNNEEGDDDDEDSDYSPPSLDDDRYGSDDDGASEGEFDEKEQAGDGILASLTNGLASLFVPSSTEQDKNNNSSSGASTSTTSKDEKDASSTTSKKKKKKNTVAEGLSPSAEVAEEQEGILTASLDGDDGSVFLLLEEGEELHSQFDSPTITNKKAIKAVQKEWKLLAKLKSSGAYVRSYLNRPDLYKVLLFGCEDTPYTDCPFAFEMKLPEDYPNSPPSVTYISYGIRLHPNLYDSGRVCLSLLGTWDGMATTLFPLPPQLPFIYITLNMTRCV